MTRSRSCVVGCCSMITAVRWRPSWAHGLVRILATALCTAWIGAFLILGGCENGVARDCLPRAAMLIQVLGIALLPAAILDRGKDRALAIVLGLVSAVLPWFVPAIAE